MRGQRARHRLAPRARSASCRSSASWPRLVQTCGITPRPWIGQPRGASTRLQVTNSSPPSGSGAMVCTRPLPRVDTADHHAAAVGRPAPRPGSRRRWRCGHRPSRPPAGRRRVRPPRRRRDRRAPHRGSRPAVTAISPCGRMVGRGDRLPQQPAAIAAQVEHDAVAAPAPRRGRARFAWKAGGGAAVEGGDPDHQHVAGALREDRLRRHHGARHPPVRACPSRLSTQRDHGVSVRPGDPARDTLRRPAPRCCGRRPRAAHRPDATPPHRAGDCAEHARDHR